MTGVLKYPQELQEGQSDYILFTNHEYRTNKSYPGQSFSSRGASGPGSGASIILYMPTTTPAVSQNNDWGDKSFAGPLGEAFAGGLTTATSGIDTADFSSFEAGVASGKKAAKTSMDYIKKQFQNAGPIARQAGTSIVANMAGMTANQLTALQRGEVYNPNVELLYNGPRLRGFNFQFQFVPKSEQEAQIVNKIILEFKKWSAPKIIQDTGMYKVPNVWEVKYMTNGTQNPHMNEFKRAACMNVAVQNNQGMNMHMSFADGMPVITTLALTFMEVDVITRDDHEAANNMVGF